jgi:hypothetical protein
MKFEKRTQVMRTLDQLRKAKAGHEKKIKEWKEEDEEFPDDPIYNNDIAQLERAIGFLNSRIKQEGGE